MDRLTSQQPTTISIYADNDITYLLQYYVVSGDGIPPRNGKYLC